MCGKTVIPKTRTFLELAAKYGVTSHKIEAPFTDIIATPRSKIHVIFEWKGETILAPVFWGFQSDGNLYNARSDSVDLPTWKNSFAFNRCVMPVLSFVEGKMHFAAPDVQPLLLAGIYGVMPSSSMFCAALLTTHANPIVAPVHQRMPVLVPPEGVRPWISPAANQQAAPLLGAFTEYTRDAKLLAA